MRCNFRNLIGFLALFAATSLRAQGVSLTLMSSGGGTFHYGIFLPAYGSLDVTEHPNQPEVLFSNLAGVTSAQVNDYLTWLYLPVPGLLTETSVGFEMEPGSQSSFGGGSEDFVVGEFVITSTAPDVGLINYLIRDDNGDIAGTILGPVSAPVEPVPEPSSVVLLSIGFLAVFFRYRLRRLSPVRRR